MAAMLTTRKLHHASRRSSLDRCPVIVLALAAVALSAGCCADHTDISGTYVGGGRLRYQPKVGATVDVAVPRDVITVKMTSRHYQYSEIEVVVRGCVFRSHGGGETSWALSDRQGAGCKLDVPGVGPVEVSLEGGLSRKPDSRSSSVESVHLSLHGQNDRVQMLWYTVDASPSP